MPLMLFMMLFVVVAATTIAIIVSIMSANGMLLSMFKSTGYCIRRAHVGCGLWRSRHRSPTAHVDSVLNKSTRTDAHTHVLVRWETAFHSYSMYAVFTLFGSQPHNFSARKLDKKIELPRTHRHCSHRYCPEVLIRPFIRRLHVLRATCMCMVFMTSYGRGKLGWGGGGRWNEG